MDFEKELLNIIEKQLGLKDIKLEIPPSMEMGDYALPCFPLTKQLKKSPVEIAKELASGVALNMFAVCSFILRVASSICFLFIINILYTNNNLIYSVKLNYYL